MAQLNINRWLLPAVGIHTGGRGLASGPGGQRFDLIQRVLLLYQIKHFQCLIAGNGRKFIQKLIYADADAYKIAKGFNSDTGSAEYRCSILDLRVDGDRLVLSHGAAVYVLIIELQTGTAKFRCVKR